MPVCKEKYQDGKLVSRLCIEGDIFLKNDYPRPQYELSQVDSCDKCPTFPTANGLSRDEVISLIYEILRERFPT
jgi:hypothetical protein